ncbi:GxxExxY protein [Micavibrio aeruginosavorus]|uniref:GxxExxY protein n=1 Tax=Micavibrio aeruginosavorus TaxID=349221 RepID=UPI0005A23237|nr:GxxExxY protein [Micavibrio aeruginosavorus]
MDTNKHELIMKDEVYDVVGCAMTVINTLGHGFLEKVYENALSIELQDKGLKIEQQKHISIFYKGQNVGEYIPDFIVNEKMIVELKTTDKIGPAERGQVLNYLKASNIRIGIILNFKNPKLEWERIIL